MKNPLHQANALETRILLLTLAFALGIIIMSWGAHAEDECGNIPVNNCTVSSSTTFALNTYNFNRTD